MYTDIFPHIHSFKDLCECFGRENLACVPQSPTLTHPCCSELTLSPPSAFLCQYINVCSPAVGEVAALGVGWSCQPMDQAAFLKW